MVEILEKLLFSKGQGVIMENFDIRGCEDLAIAIVKQACEDYINDKVQLCAIDAIEGPLDDIDYVNKRRLKRHLREHKKWFEGNWCQSLVSFDVPSMIRRLDEEAEVRYKKLMEDDT